MVKIALDPATYHATMSVADEVRKAADLGYEYLELSPRADWFSSGTGTRRSTTRRSPR
jgi:myo-inositol catabolism protein IolH